MKDSQYYGLLSFMALILAHLDRSFWVPVWAICATISFVMSGLAQYKERK